MTITPITRRNGGFQSAMALAFALYAHRLQLERSHTGRPDDILFRERFDICDAPALHHSARPDVARASGHHSAHHVDAHAPAYGCRGVQRLQDHAGHHPGRRTRQPDSGRARTAGQSRPANARREQPRLFAVAGRLFEGGRFLPPRGQELCPRTGPVSAPRHRPARSGAGRIGPQPGPGGPERG